MKVVFSVVVSAWLLGCGAQTPVQQCLSLCSGCCDSLGVCQTGLENSACGAPGKLCAACGSNMSCTSTGTCANNTTSQCRPSNCSGCCDSSGACHVNSTTSACGAGGNACVVCTGA